MKSATMNVTEYDLSHEGTPAELSFLFSDFQLQRKEVEGMIKNIGTPILATGEGIAEPGVVHLFDSEEAFEQWARRTRFARKFDEITSIISRTRTGLTQDEARSVRLVANTPIEGRFAVESTPHTDAELVPSIELFEEENFNGKSFTIGVAAITDLAEIEFSHSASSIRVSGVCLLTDQVMFGGARLYLVGDPQLDITDLKAWGFNNCAASAIII